MPLDVNIARSETGKRGSAHMSELEDKDTTTQIFEEKLHKLIKRARKQRGMLWPSVVSRLELARADVRSMIKVYDSGPK
jgi:ribosome-binding protein aMBF1 (putative translation factor)